MRKVICTCDRCGKKFSVGEAETVVFYNGEPLYTLHSAERGTVCKECYQDFLDLAKSFFDDLNKEAQE